MNYHTINKITNKICRPRYKYVEKFNSVKYVCYLYLNFNEKETDDINELVGFLENKFIEITTKFILNNKNIDIVKKRLNMIITFLDYPEYYTIRNMYLDYRDYYIDYENL
jgi:hypothetical protein